jgi:hypothetical protein
MRSVLEEPRSVWNLLDGDFPVLDQDSHSTQYEVLKQLVYPFGHTDCDQYETVSQDVKLVGCRNISESEEHMAPSSTEKQLSPHTQTAANKSKCHSVRGDKDENVDHFSSSEDPEEKLISGTGSSASVRGEPGTARTRGEIANRHTVGEDLCSSLLCLYEIHNLSQGPRDKSSDVRAKTLVTHALSSVVAVSRAAKRMALKRGLLEMLVVQLRELHIKLSVESAENLRRIRDKGKVSGQCVFLWNACNSLLSTLASFLFDTGQWAKMSNLTIVPAVSSL